MCQDLAKLLIEAMYQSIPSVTPPLPDKFSKLVKILAPWALLGPLILNDIMALRMRLTTMPYFSAYNPLAVSEFVRLF